MQPSLALVSLHILLGVNSFPTASLRQGREPGSHWQIGHDCTQFTGVGKPHIFVNQGKCLLYFYVVLMDRALPRSLQA